MDKAWVRFNDIAALCRPDVGIIQGRATNVDCDKKTATVVLVGGQEVVKLQYDYLIVASGLRRVWPVVPQSLRRKQYLFEAGGHIKTVSDAPHGVVVVGGGTFYERPSRIFLSLADQKN